MEKKSIAQLDPDLVVSLEEVAAKLFKLKALPMGMQFGYLESRGWQLEFQGTSLDPASRWTVPHVLLFARQRALCLDSALRLQCIADLVKGKADAKEAAKSARS